jgi:hypothetical protein
VSKFEGRGFWCSDKYVVASKEGASEKSPEALSRLEQEKFELERTAEVESRSFEISDDLKRAESEVPFQEENALTEYEARSALPPLDPDDPEDLVDLLPPSYRN